MFKALMASWSPAITSAPNFLMAVFKFRTFSVLFYACDNKVKTRQHKRQEIQIYPQPTLKLDPFPSINTFIVVTHVNISN